MKVARFNSKRIAWDGINRRFAGQPIKRVEYIIKLGRIPNPKRIPDLLHDTFWDRTNNIRRAVTSQGFRPL